MAFLSVTEVLNLNSLGIQTPVGINECSLSSNNWLSSREASQSSAGQILIVNIIGKEVIKTPVIADAAIICPEGRYLAIRKGRILEVFDLNNSHCLKGNFIIDSNVAYWKWVNSEVLAMVFDREVVHWSMAEPCESKVAMIKHSKMAGVPINYRANENLQWLMLVTASSIESHVIGCIQLHSIEKGCSQIIEGQAACFIQHKMLRNDAVCELFSFVNFSSGKSELCTAPVGKPKEGDVAYIRTNGSSQIPVGTSSDFPVSIEPIKELSLIFIVWKSAFIVVHDVESGLCLYAVPVISSPVFATVLNADNGILMINKMGSLLSTNLSLELFFQHLEKMNLTEIASKIMFRLKLSSGNNFILKWFDVLLQGGKYDDAVWVAVNAPDNLLRTPETLGKLKELTQITPSPLLTYFKLLLDKTKLFTWESIELCRPIVQQRKLDLMEKLLMEEKLECSEDLGDLLFPLSKKLALSTYVRANVAQKAILCFAEEEQYSLLFSYAEKMSYKPDMVIIISSFLNTQLPAKAFHLALWMAQNEKLNEIVGNVVGLFIERGFIDESIKILEILARKNTSEVATQQTQLLMLYLQHHPQKADEILEKSSFQFINRIVIADLCEKVGMWHRALYLYDNIVDWKRVLSNAPLINFHYLQAFFETVPNSLILPCITSILVKKENVDIAIKVATVCVSRVPTIDLLRLFEDLKDAVVIFKFLSNVISTEIDEHIQLKYIEVAVEIGKWCELITYCKNSNISNPVKIRNFLMGKKLKNAIPLMIVCDRFDFVDEMTAFLINSDMEQYFKYFLENINGGRLVAILERALSLGAKDALILDIIALSHETNVEDALSVVEKHGRLIILLPWLENMEKRGSQSKALHTAMIKINILQNHHSENILLKSDLYDTYKVGMFSSNINPELSIIAFTKGGHDKELITLCEKNGLIKPLTRYLLCRSDIDLWRSVLESGNIKNDAIVEGIAYLVTTESFTSDAICSAVKAIMAADLQTLLLKLLETLVFDCPEFTDNKNLQNLYILSAMKTDKAQVKELITRLKNFDAFEIAELARSNGLFEEALMLYQRCEALNLAMDVILHDIKNLKQAEDFAVRCCKADLWIKLGEALLNAGSALEAIDAFIKGEDSTHYEAIVKVATDHQLWTKLIEYLEIANTNSKEQNIEAELIFLYAKTNMTEKLKKLASQPILADIKCVAERCFENELFEAASILFDMIGCYSRLAETLALKGNLEDSVTSARKANSVQCWKTLCYAALSKENIAIACEAAQHMITDPDLMEDVVLKFQEHGFTNEIITTFEKAVASGSIVNSAITNLSILLIRHQPERCRNFLEEWCRLLNIPRVLKALEECHMWFEVAFLLERNSDFYEAINVMINHPTEAWVHLRFKDLLTKVAGNRLIPSIIQFYLEFKPTLLNDLLIHIGSRWDATKVISTLSSANHLSLIKPYLETRSKEDTIAVNSACCDLFIQEGDWINLQTFLKSQKNIDTTELALLLENHDSIGFRMVSVDLYLRCQRWKDAMRICRRDNLFNKAIDVAQSSNDKTMVQDLLLYLLKENEPYYFSALLFKCYNLIDPDLVLELTWYFDAWQYALPYFVQVVKNLTALISEMKELKKNKLEDGQDTEIRMLTWNPSNE